MKVEVVVKVIGIFLPECFLTKKFAKVDVQVSSCPMEHRAKEPE